MPQIDHEKIKQELDCTGGAYYLPNPPGLPEERFRMKNWWAKEWYNDWREVFANSSLNEMRRDARLAPFAGLCIGTGRVRGWWRNAYSRLVAELRFTPWSQSQIEEITGYFQLNPLEAAHLLDGRLTHRLADHINAHNMPFLMDSWVENTGSDYVSFIDGVLAYIMAFFIDTDPKWLFLLHGYGVDQMYAVFDEDLHKYRQEPHADDQSEGLQVDVLQGFRLSQELPPLKTEKRRPLLSNQVGGLPLDFSVAIQSVARQVTAAAERALTRFDPPTWEPEPLFPDIPEPPPMPDLPEAQVERFEDITTLDRDFYAEYYPDEAEILHDLTRRLVGLALTTEQAKFIQRGFPKTWACAVAALLTQELEPACTVFDVSPNTTPNRVRQLRDALQIREGDRAWMTPRQRAARLHPHLWRNADGLIVVRRIDSDG